MSSAATATQATSSSRSEHLVRGLSLLDATMIVIGSMIGSGIFLVSAVSATLVGAPGWLLVAWLLGGVLTITGALSCAELAAMMPRAGGQYVFLREAYGPSFGFLFGWALFLVVQTGTIAAVAVAFANFLGVLVPTVSSENYLIAPHALASYAISLSTQQVVAVALILLLTFTNINGLKTGKFIQNTFTFTKTAALLALVVVGLTIGWKVGLRNGGAAFTSSWWHPTLNGWKPDAAQLGFQSSGKMLLGLALIMLLGRAMSGPLFAQSAWNNVTFTGAEVKDPGRNLPRALLIGCGVVVTLYLLANLAYVVVLPLHGIQTAEGGRVGTAAMQAIFGPPGRTIMAIAIMISTFGCNNGLILAGARVYYAMACDNLFFKRVGTLNAKHVPAVALITQGIWASLLTLPRTVTTDTTTGKITYGNVYSQLIEYLTSADLIFYGLMVAAVIVLRKKAAQLDRPYRTFGYPIVPLIYIALAFLFVIDLGYLAPKTSGVGYLIVLTGLPAYLIWRRQAKLV
ncbi:MAG TPA: amino acid permease [Pyrinomonadaceae bacterium]|jgi:APA family basic amino acid/polyamine antiporter|nr:amino acid permease [Pyrinomonadaceae bacterium]